MRRLRSCAAVLAALCIAACGEPPNKEMDQAQGAIDAARAAGAEQYAADEYTAATTALKQANDAVTQRDYRLALNFALESREHAQNAARDAAETRARVRGEVERGLAEVAALLAQANSRVAAAEKTRVPRRTLRDAQQNLARVNDDVQKAGAAMQAEDYRSVQPVVDGLKERIQAIIAALDAAAGAQSAQRRR
jgi:hypothetical protein